MAIERHTYKSGIVGNCSYMAHVDDHARVVWLCWPRFDSSFVFGPLLDTERGGGFEVQTIAATTGQRQEYLWNTNVLQTTIETSDGGLRVTDCAPRFVQHQRVFKPLMFIRKLEPLTATPRIRMCCRPRGDYGAVTPRVNLQSDHVRYDIGCDIVRLNSNIPLSYVIGEREFVLSDPKYIVLTWGVPFENPLEDTAEEYIRRTSCIGSPGFGSARSGVSTNDTSSDRHWCSSCTSLRIPVPLWPRERRVCPNSRKAVETGIIATAGCATRISR